MYLSRVELNPFRRDTMRALASPHRMHGAVKMAFPHSVADKNRALWRLDTLAHALYLLILSASKPDCTHIVEQFGRPASEQGWDIRDYDALLDRLSNGQEWHFRLCANPVRSVKAEAGSKDRGKVCALNVEQQKQWLLERAEKWGFSLDERFELVARDLKRFPHGERAVTLSVAFFEGLLTVRDAALLRQAMIVGIGRAKAYGCGMLTLARPA